MVFGIIDIGSNSIKLLIAESDSKLAMRYSSTLETRISKGLGNDKPFLESNSMKAGVETVQEFIENAAAFNPEAYFLVATSAVRDAANRDAFISMIEQATGYRLQVLSGDQEARYIGYGILSDPVLEGINDFCLIDLGGGSMECICIQNRELTQKVSLQLGAVRLSENCLEDSSAPMSAADIANISTLVRTKLNEAPFTFPKNILLVGSGGAFNVARAIRAAWVGKSFEEIGSDISVKFLEHLFEEISQLTLQERLQVPELPEARADIMPTALLVLLTLAKHCKASKFQHSRYNLRYGIAAKVHQEIQEHGILPFEYTL